MSQQPSDHYTRSIQPPIGDGSQRRVQVYPVERGHATYYPDGSRGDPSLSGDSRDQQWCQARGEPAVQNARHSDYHASQHYIPADTHSGGEDLEYVTWRGAPPQSSGALYTQDSRTAVFLSPQPTDVHSQREHQYHASAWAPLADDQARGSSEQGYDPHNTYHFNPSRESRRGDTVLMGSGSTSQSFGPYTTTVLHQGRSHSTSSRAEDHLRSRSPPHTPYSVQPHTLTHQILHNPEPLQYVVPSSRIPRVDPTAHASPTGHFNTARVSHSPEESSETKPKRRRANAAQLQLLNETYARTMFPTTEERADIARRINMTPRQVQIWFQNRRQASRQSQSLDPGTPSGSMEGMHGEAYSDYLHEPEND